MRMDAVAGPLKAQLGLEATECLLQLLDVSQREWRQDVMAACTERFERRLVEEASGLRVQIARTEAVLRRDMAEMGAGIRQEMAQMGANLRVDMLKWCFLFWIGQVLAISSIFGVMLRTIR